MLCFIFILFFITRSSALIELLNLDEGSKCTWKNVSGECVKIHKCLSMHIDLRDKDYAPICSFRGKEPIVCCTDCELVNDTRQLIIDYNLGILEKTGQKAHDKCLEYLNTIHYPCKISNRASLYRTLKPEANCNKIDTYRSKYGASFGGVNARRAQFPHMALLGYGDDYTSLDWLCGGSVISDRFILTAGHCLSSPALGQVKYVALGILKRSDPPELWQNYKVKRVIPHPEYHPPSKYHDIALLETETTIAYNDQVRPACLHTKGEELESLYATGWGALGHKRQLADILQAVTLSKFEDKECAKYYPPHRHLQNGYNHTTQMCYGDKTEPKDTCEGDSGGPLQSTEYIIFNCVDTVVGITSYGRPCGISAGPGIYTRVIHYVPWIESVVWP